MIVFFYQPSFFCSKRKWEKIDRQDKYKSGEVKWRSIRIGIKLITWDHATWSPMIQLIPFQLKFMWTIYFRWGGHSLHGFQKCQKRWMRDHFWCRPGRLHRIPCAFPFSWFTMSPMTWPKFSPPGKFGQFEFLLLQTLGRTSSLSFETNLNKTN